VSLPSSGDTVQLPFLVEDGCAKLVLDIRVYRLAAIHKAGYRLAARFTLALGSLDDSFVTAVLIPTPEGGGDLRAAVAAFYRELCDQELRENIAEQTKDIRALLLAHAFSHTDLVKRG